MLDKLPIGEPEPAPPLKCENCGLLFEEGDDWDNIDLTGMCCDCQDSNFPY